jgi:hypothetical protein
MPFMSKKEESVMKVEMADSKTKCFKRGNIARSKRGQNMDSKMPAYF